MNKNSPVTNALKLIIFRINEEQPYYGINVFKTFEIQRAKHYRISEIPRANEFIEGIVYIRNQPVPLVNLPRWLRTDLSEQEERNSSIIFCNFNNIQIALRVGGIHQIITRDWEDVLPLQFHEYMPVDRNLSYTLLDDGSSVCLILDVEYLLTEVLPYEFSEIQKDVQNLSLNDFEIPGSLKNGTILVAEDSRSAQMYLKNFFEKFNLSFKIFENGGPLLDYVEEISDHSKIPLIITDIEMPIVSGHEVIRRLKSDARTKHIPILVFSSMTNDQSRKAVRELGADGFVGKLSVEQMVKQLSAVARIPLASSFS
tara:strand:- start:905 stop:1843 length:939 start_codon:yes stop_codon:yes gene_type:complete